MRKQLMILFFVLPLLIMGQNEPIQTRDTLTLIENIYYERDSYIASDEERAKLAGLVSAMQADSTLKIHVVGYSDKWGGEEVNRRFSYVRAKYIGDWIYSCRVTREQITYIGAGIDSLAPTTAKARRVEVLQVVPLMINATNDTVCHSELDSESIEVDSELVQEAKEKQEAQHPAQQPMEDMSVSEKVADIPEQTEKLTPNYYIGAGVGSSVAWSTFSGAGVKAQILGGVEFSELISTELSLGYSNISMNATPCCENLYLVDGERFFASVAGKDSYRYGDLSSKVNLLQLTAKANFNLVSIWLKDSPWHGLISPKIGYIHSSAHISDITKASSSHFTAGIDLSAGYEITENWGLRLTTGFEYLTGKGIDALPQHEHGTNTLWSTTINAIYRL